MALTSAQLTALKADIAADGTLNTIPNNDDGDYAIAAIYNTQASPDWTIWKKSVLIADVGTAIDAAEMAGLSTLNSTRLQTLAVFLSSGVNPSLVDHRAFFDDIFSGAGGTNTRPRLLVLWKRLASRAEKLFSTGTGSDASPATTASNIGEGFKLSQQDVRKAKLS